MGHIQENLKKENIGYVLMFSVKIWKLRCIYIVMNCTVTLQTSPNTSKIVFQKKNFA